jgi:putative FmdB family regulatory protein
MPTYEYQCKNCGHVLEELQSFTEPPLVQCPQCKQNTLARILGGGSGLIFKGSGFYLTDYKKSNAAPSPAKPKKEKTSTDTSTPSTPPPADSKPPAPKKE